MSISYIAEGIGSQAAFKIDASTSLSMTFKRWVNCYIVTIILVRALKEFEETYVVLAEQTKVLYLIFQVCDALDTHTECIA